MKLRSFERPNAGFISPSKALEHMLGASPAVPSHRMKLQAATVSSGGGSELRVALVSNFSDDTLAVEAMLREGQPESDAVPQPVPAPWCIIRCLLLLVCHCGADTHMVQVRWRVGRCRRQRLWVRV